MDTALSISTSAARVMSTILDLRPNYSHQTLQYEELLRNVEDDDPATQQAISCTTAAYHAARMDLVRCSFKVYITA